MALKMNETRLTDCNIKYVYIMCVLGTLFSLRILGQLIQKVSNFSFLPTFEEWQGGPIPYPWLLASQLIILGAMVFVIRGFAQGRFRPNPRLGVCLLAFGSLYFGTMFLRLCAGLTFASEHPWFGATIPAFFHMVLASFILVLGHFHYGRAVAKKFLSWAVYPLVLAIILGIYYGLLSSGLSLTLSAYISAIICGLLLITFFEIVLPYEKEWAPNLRDITTDSICMLVVQAALPKFLAVITSLYLVSFLNDNNIILPALWPSHWPIWLQMLTMMFIADFFRYWLHRAMHEWEPLWRLHAVHHSVEKMYWLNVGRFHPIDKSLQFVVETMPFILIGVSAEVTSLYFVVYSVKGFFQHSNVDTKLGWLNYIVSGPELHRWHHSQKIVESNSNYGNNVIIWDIVFGTFFWPKDRTVKKLGLLNEAYPTDFLSLLRNPFVKGLDKSNEGSSH